MTQQDKENPVYKGKYFKVYEEEVHGHTHSNVYRSPISVIFPISDKGELFLISQYREFFQKRILEAPAGHINEGETPLDAAKRELLEETGIIASQWEEISRIETSASVIKSPVHFFIVKNLENGKSSPEEGEDIELVKISLKEAVDKVLSGEIFTGSTAFGILLIDKLKLIKKR